MSVNWGLDLRSTGGPLLLPEPSRVPSIDEWLRFLTEAVFVGYAAYLSVKDTEQAGAEAPPGRGRQWGRWGAAVVAGLAVVIARATTLRQDALGAEPALVLKDVTVFNRWVGRLATGDRGARQAELACRMGGRLL